MILTVTLNTALDLTYSVNALVPGSTHRVSRVLRRAGGKGLNVARVLHRLGVPVLATGLCGGRTGGDVLHELAVEGVSADFVEVAGESRRTVAVVSATAGDATMFAEPGPEITAPEWQRFLFRYAELTSAAEVVVLAGSLPTGLPVDAYHCLVAAAGDTPTVLDAEGPALLAALAAQPDVIKPNAHELRAATTSADPTEGAQELRRLGARSVLASLGPDGLLALTSHGDWRARPPHRVAGNPTGAGDSCVAAVAAGLRVGMAWPDVLRQAVALSAATVSHPVAGDFDTVSRDRFLTEVQVVRLG